MSTAVESGNFADIRAKVHETTRNQVQQWFDLCDWVLDIHRDRFVRREPSAEELEQHRQGVGECINGCHALTAVLEGDSIEDRRLASGLRIRLKQLEDAYNTFHDSDLSDEEANQILERVFPG